MKSTEFEDIAEEYQVIDPMSLKNFLEDASFENRFEVSTLSLDQNQTAKENIDAYLKALMVIGQDKETLDRINNILLARFGQFTYVALKILKWKQHKTLMPFINSKYQERDIGGITNWFQLVQLLGPRISFSSSPIPI